MCSNVLYLKNIDFSLFYMHEYSAFMYHSVPGRGQYLRRPEESTGYPEIGFTEGCYLLCGHQN